MLNRLMSCLVALIAYAHRSVPVYAAWFQLPRLQPARGPL